jgi:Uri superfamily endonuclease
VEAADHAGRDCQRPALTRQAVGYRTGIPEMKSKPGTYALILKSDLKHSVQVGRWRQIDIQPGYYIYIGSAFGSGGIQARVLRHFRSNKRRHWHIDYLREHLNPVGVWYSHDPRRLEHRWAQTLCSAKGMSPIQGFGCSDCMCYSHLFLIASSPDIALFSRIAKGKIESWSYQPAG